jgi:predicted ABC-type ATPase
MLKQTLKDVNPTLYGNLEDAGDLDNYVAVKADEASEAIVDYMQFDDMSESDAQDLAIAGLIPDEEIDESPLDDDGGGEEDAIAAMQDMFADSVGSKMALQVGTVVNKGGHQYVLNENHRWTRKDAGQPKPQGQQKPQQAVRPKLSQDQMKASMAGQKPPQSPLPKPAAAKSTVPNQPKQPTAAPTATPQPQQPEAVPAAPKPVPVSKGAVNPAGLDTFEQHQKDGQWSPERQALHQKIIDKHFSGKKPAVGQAIAYVLGGGPASGKSSIIHAGHVSVDPDAIHIDSDAIKGELPEYNEMVGSKDDRAAAFAHEESSYIGKLIQEKASRSGYHTLLDGTGDSSFESLKKKIDLMKASGQKVVGHYVTVPTEVAIARNAERAKKTGRLPPVKMLRACHAGVSQIVPKALEAGLFDEFDLWDTETGVKRVATVRNGQTQILDQGLWGKFLAKGFA